MSKPALVVMARYPTPGRVKTRLARTIGNDAACALHHAFLQDIGRRFGSRADLDLVWAFEPADADFRAVVGSRSRCFAQAGEGLAQRMDNAFRHLFAAGYRGVVMIGADVPHVHDESIAQALQALDSADVVLGPSEDGGYYLAAMRTLHDIFRGIPMGTDAVLSGTLSRVHSLGLQVHLLPKDFDVDEVKDLVRLRELVGDEGWAQRLPRTLECLLSIDIRF